MKAVAMKAVAMKAVAMKAVAMKPAMKPVVPNPTGLAKAPGSLSPEPVAEIAKHGRALAPVVAVAGCKSPDRNRRRRVAIHRVPRRVRRVRRESDGPRDTPRRVDAAADAR